MKIKINSFSSLLHKISIYQLITLSILGFFSTSFLISGIFTFFFTQLIRLSYLNKYLALYGFPIRLILLAPPCAILVHKLHANLLALFSGFVIGQMIYFIFIWSFTKEK